ncbi:MAG: hypothetical protein JWP95_1482 [Actinotalea sp.]|nr:hypothetical protein [Actinotalea sp.]
MPSAGTMTLRRRLSVALTASGIVLTIIVAVAVWALIEVEQRQYEISQVYFPAIAQADAAFVSFVDAETAVRGYALTGDPVILEPIERLTNAPEPAVDVEQRLIDHLGPSHEVVRVRERAAEAARVWFFEFAEPTIERVRADGPGTVEPADIEAGVALFDDIRVEVGVYSDLLAQGRLDALDALEQAMLTLRLTLGALVLAPILVGILLWIFLRRWVTDPLDILAADARTVAGGDLDHHVTDAGPGEVGDLARDIELMRDRLATSVSESAHAKAELEISHARLREQAEDLGRSNRDLEQFAYVASHDLQEPLRKIASFTQLLAKRYEGQLDERADQYIGFAVDGAKRMQRLINDLLGFSRVGRIGGELADVDLGSCLEQAKNDLQHVIDETGATVTAQGLPHVSGEGPLLVQLMVNLLGNALKFRHPDRAPVVRFESRRAGDVWELSCRDNGIGIDPQYADRVFVIFQRLHAKDVYEGTGIGLALCKKIVEYHGGEIWIDSDEEEGAVVRWTLPVRTPGLVPQAEQALQRHAHVHEDVDSSVAGRTMDA